MARGHCRRAYPRHMACGPLRAAMAPPVKQPAATLLYTSCWARACASRGRAGAGPSDRRTHRSASRRTSTRAEGATRPARTCWYSARATHLLDDALGAGIEEAHGGEGLCHAPAATARVSPVLHHLLLVAVASVVVRTHARPRPAPSAPAARAGVQRRQPELLNRRKC
eukprot:scaffold842_cov357-Prasinococcus_capsulatus_cf.AAC.10